MCRDGRRFRVVERVIPCTQELPPYLVGVVKVQMPEQCEAGMWFRVRDAERERNLSIVQSVIESFGTWGAAVGAPAIILFPELSVTTDAAGFLFDRMLSDNVSANTLVVFGLEQLSTDDFVARVADSNSSGEFGEGSFGPNIDRVNTAVILAKDRDGVVRTYYQPKCTLSDYESRRQFTSDLVYSFVFGTRHLIVSICSDFLLHDGTGAVVGSVMQDIDSVCPAHQNHRLDIVLLIQKNPSPMNPLYSESVRHLYFNRPHRIQTEHTIVCAVNSVDPSAPDRFGESNVSVMRRGRPPSHFRNRVPHDHFAWLSLPANARGGDEQLHLLRWRLREAGVISFVLNTDGRPWQLEQGEPVPVKRVGIFGVGEGADLTEIVPVPEVYELQTVLYAGFADFVRDAFPALILHESLERAAYHRVMLEELFKTSPHELIDLLLVLHECGKNCDHWDISELACVFRHFILAICLIKEAQGDLSYRDSLLRAAGRSLGIVDCKDLALRRILQERRLPMERVQHVDILLLQRLSDIFLWDGNLTSLDALLESASVSKAPSGRASGRSVAAAPSPCVADLASIIKDINRRCENADDIGSVINDYLQLA